MTRQERQADPRRYANLKNFVEGKPMPEFSSESSFSSGSSSYSGGSGGSSYGEFAQSQRDGWDIRPSGELDESVGLADLDATIGVNPTNLDASREVLVGLGREVFSPQGSPRQTVTSASPTEGYFAELDNFGLLDEDEG